MPKKSRSSTITVEREDDRLPPIPPGEILLGEFMRPFGISQNRLARELHLPPTRIHEIVHGRRAITPDTALRLARFFGTTAEFWLNLQQRYDLLRTEREQGDEIRARVRPLAATRTGDVGAIETVTTGTEGAECS